MAKTCQIHFDCYNGNLDDINDGSLALAYKRETSPKITPPTTFGKRLIINDILGECIEDECVKPKCGNCNEKAENGPCCYGTVGINDICGCRCRNELNCPDNAFCSHGWCVTKAADQTCGACGEKAIHGRCCGRAIVDNIKKNGMCICDIGDGCQSWNHCVGNSVCCSDHNCYPNTLTPCPIGTHEL